MSERERENKGRASELITTYNKDEKEHKKEG